MLETLMMKAAIKRVQSKACFSSVEREQARQKVSLQLLQSMVNHFVEDEFFCYFADMYSPEYSLQWIYEVIMKYNIDEYSRKLLEEEHKEIFQSECYEGYGVPSYIDK